MRAAKRGYLAEFFKLVNRYQYVVRRTTGNLKCQPKPISESKFPQWKHKQFPIPEEEFFNEKR